jgi:hypothetical protein
MRRFNPDFLRERRAILQDYLDQMLSLPGVLDIRDVRRFLEVRRLGPDPLPHPPPYLRHIHIHLTNHLYVRSFRS